jgi:UDP-glucose 4-epimerase
MKILITGSSGFIGQHLINSLKYYYELVCPTEQELDIRDGERVAEYVTVHRPDYVIHLAAKTEVAWSFHQYEEYTRTNYLGTVHLAEACRYNRDFKRFIFASSMETYGEQPAGIPFTEDTPQNPRAPYAVAKLAAEKYLMYMHYAYGFPYTILRQTNAYGRTNTTFFVMERIISQMLDGEVVNLGEPEPWRNFLFIDDLMELYSHVLVKDKALNQVFVTGPNNALSISDLVTVCADVLQWKGEVNWHTIPKRVGEVYYLNSDPAKTERLLGWKPKTELKDGIRKTADRILAARQVGKAA